MKTAVYPGSFDPVTYGHLDIVKRASMMFDKVIVTVMHNSAKSSLFSVDERVKMIKEAVSEFSNVEVDSYDGLLIDYCREKQIHIVVRGLRAITDFEYELQIAQTNRELSHNNVDSVFLTTNLRYSYLSSSTVKEIASYGGEVSGMVPENVFKALELKYNNHLN
ncbi:MAG: pantetheine-phosphate adenylyltransferase [Butyrivibrio sp.]|uniref:pantetheine-phosphate adenylyltransferase n=1 Tax=Butyrivibrio sp. TaxID=28121 RepID=UPI0025E80BDC|nr:pantetheine-phosphate adenylyltransferase [Butyrivibrio sp.]MCR5770044.1 pantetheine-phosphate adenylyltransferase [Butyrivibrio sp.]